MTRKQDNNMDNENDVFVDRPKRNPSKWKKNKGGDNWNGKATKGYKARVKELEEDDLDEDARNYDER